MGMGRQQPSFCFTTSLLSMFGLPSDFIHTIENTYGEAGKQLIANLPVLIEEASQRWDLTDVQPVPNLSYNFVAFANRPLTAPLHGSAPPAGTSQNEVVLKIGVPQRELTSEMAALRLFDGEGFYCSKDCSPVRCSQL